MNKDTNQKWTQIITRIPKAHKGIFSGSKADMGNAGLIITLNDSGADMAKIERITAQCIQSKADKFFGAGIKINYQKPLPTIPNPEPKVDDSNDIDTDDYHGVYHNPENAILQPEKTEWSATQYYRKNWRPLLGPTLSELVRELRQRCHFKSGRNGFETTYKSLAAALGVSTKTIERALKRDGEGNFKNEYLGYFIADIQTIKVSNGQSNIHTKGTRFLVYLDDTLTPDDKAKSRNRQFVR